VLNTHLWFAVKKKSASQNDEKSFLRLYRPKFDILWFEKKYDVERKFVNFFIKGVRVVRASIAESFSLAGDTYV
jgi:hypothetical protein